MKQTEMTLDAALKIVDAFSPIKVIFNNCILYNDYDDEIPCGEDVSGQIVYGEVLPAVEVIRSRLYRYSSYVVTSIKVEIVQHHHSIVTITGHYDARAAEEGKLHES